MQLSVVIPSYNSGPGLTMLLASLGQQKLPAGHRFDVIVVDDGSTDGTRELVERLPSYDYELQYIFKPRTSVSGRASARNAGIAAAGADVVVMVDADQVVSGTFIAEHARYHSYNDALVVIGPRYNLDHTSVGHAPDGRLDFSRVSGDISGEIRDGVFTQMSHNLNNLATCWHFMYTCNVSVRRAHLAAVGGFDSAFLGWGLEDADLGYRLRQRGLNFAFNPAAVLYHLQPQPWNPTMYASWRRNLDYFSSKYSDLEAAAQRILDRAFNPEEDQRSLGWLESVLRFEYAVRALRGRYPGTAQYKFIEVDNGNLDAILPMVAEFAPESDLFIIDHTADAELAAVVQCTKTARDVVLFRQPDNTNWPRILAMHPTISDRLIESAAL